MKDIHSLKKKHQNDQSGRQKVKKTQKRVGTSVGSQ